MNALEKVDAAARLLIYLLCIDTNADKATYKVEGFRHIKRDIVYGDYELTIRRISRPKEKS